MILKKSLVGLILGLMLIPVMTFGEGISLDTYGEVLVENLAIGESYSMMKLINLPYRVNNLSKQSAYLQIQPVKPQSSELKPGFEIIDNLDWINMGNSLVAIAANGTYDTDIVLTIPKDKKYLGKKYQVFLAARFYDPNASLVALSLGVMGRLLFTVAEVEQPLRTNTKSINMNYKFVPGLLEMKDVKLGKKIELSTDKHKKIVIKNYGDKKIKGELVSLDPTKTIHKIYKDYEACPNPDFLKFEKTEVIVKGKKEKAIKMWLEIPDKGEFKGKKSQFTTILLSFKSSNLGSSN